MSITEVAAQTDDIGDQVTLIIADYADTDAAQEAYDALWASQSDSFVIESAVVAQRDENGTLEIADSDHSTRQGLGWGAVAGAVVGILFPPSILAGVVGGGIVGTIVGKLREHHHKKEISDDLGDAIDVGHSAVIVVADDTVAAQVVTSLQSAVKTTQKQINKETLKAIRDEAKQD